MRSDVQQVIDEVSAWDDIMPSQHRFGGMEFNLGNVEVGHIHSNGMLDIPFTRKIAEILVAEGECQPHHLLPETGWITFYMCGDDDVSQALWLLRLSYLQKTIRRRKDQREVVERELESLHLSRALAEIYAGMLG
jgi:Ni,Fe-hydrogenase I large subunit